MAKKRMTEAERYREVKKQYVAFHKYLCKKFGGKYPFKDEWERGRFVNEHCDKLTPEEKAMFPALDLTPLEEYVKRKEQRDKE